MLQSLILVSAGLLGSAHAFWRMECPGRVGMARVDPIVNFGEVSPHVHAIHGSNGFSLTATTADLLAGDCTSCRVTQDRSSYWHPAMYFQDSATGEFEAVEQVGGLLAYYLLNYENVTAFPPEFRMVAGDNYRRTFTAGDPSLTDPEKSLWAADGPVTQDVLGQRAIGFNCLNYAAQPEGTLYRHYMPEKSFLDANCADGLRLELMFPSCWNGQDLDSDNHRDHVAYPDLVMSGTCPEDFPVQMPGILFETIYNTAAFNDRDGLFVMANGDPTGFGYHGDFLMGWEDGVLEEAVETCLNPSGRIEDCGIFNIVDEATAKSCEFPLPDALADEDVEGPFNILPGSVQITYEDGSPEDDVAVPLPSLDLPGASPSNTATPVPGQVFVESSVYVPPVPSTPIPEVAAVAVESSSTPTPSTSSSTPTPAPSSDPVDPNVSYESTQYITNGNVVSKILWKEEIVWETLLVDATATVTVQGGPPEPSPEEGFRRRRREAHLHGHVHGHH